ncbi:cathepsin L 2-like [Bemisia tabaci]|uniref:cathepsin L 2-like n=1 Tax=Bemisia tabaci TaxID=7038 RepID=UPI003B282BE2
MEYIKKYGLPTAIAYPYTAMTGNCKTHVAVNPYAKIADFIRADPRKLEEHLRFSPLPTDVHAKAELQFYVSGVFETDYCPDGPGDANHGVVIVGHYKDAWILRDSAPSSWGLQGHFLMQKGICGIGSTDFESFEIYNPHQPKMRRNTYSFP